MRIRNLGCSGGIGAGSRTSAMLVDDDVLIDAGTGIGDPGLEELHRIRHVFLTHSINDVTWPDFAKIPTADNSMLRYQTCNPGESVTIGSPNSTLLM